MEIVNNTGKAVLFLALFSVLVFLAACSGPAPQANTTAVSENVVAGAAEVKTDPATQETESYSDCGGCPYAQGRGTPADTDVTPGSTALASSELVSVILLTTSDSCACTMTRCQEGEAALDAALAKVAEDLTLEKVDQAEQRDRLKELVKKYPASILPVVYFLDKDGKLLDQLEGDFTETQVGEIVGRYAVSGE